MSAVIDLDSKTADEIIVEFDLHPLEGEGGYFSHIQSSAEGNSIFFLLKAGDFSAWHRLKERETWVLLAGDALDLHIYLNSYQHFILERSACALSHSVEPGEWMAASTLGKWSLILCFLAPAFSGMELATSDQVRSWREIDSKIPELFHE